MNISDLGRSIFLVGLIIMAIGLLFWIGSRLFSIRDFPGTIRFEIGELTCVIPIFASILASIILTVVLNLIFRILK